MATGAAGAVAARAAYRTLRQHPPAGEKTWTRTNHRGELVTLLEGPAVAVGAIAAEVIGGRGAPPGGRVGKVNIKVFPNGPLAPTPPSR